MKKVNVTTLAQLKRYIEEEIGNKLNINNLPEIDLSNNSIELDARDILIFKDKVKSFKDFGKIEYNNYQCIVYFKNGEKAFDILSKGFRSRW